MMRAGVWAAAVVAMTGLVAGCSSAPTATEPSTSAPASPTASGAPATGTVAVSAENAAVEHIHNLALVGDDLLMGSHEGLFRQSPGSAPELVSEPFDVMGFTIGEKRWLASGHPGAQMQAPPDLGLLESQDDGRSWSSVSLSGQADFHRLAASGDTVLGVNSGDGMLWRSTDAGKNWETLGPGPFDIALDPRDGDAAVGTTQEGPIASTDGGRNWRPISGAPLMALVAWTPAGIWGVSPEGVVHSSDDSGSTWKRTGSVDQNPEALAADKDRVVILAGGKVWESLDGGATFEPRITGLPGH